jgi:hypothetical protein
MAADMGMGLKVYKAEIGRPLRREDLVSIFACGPDVEPASVEEQKAFQREYFRSKERRPDLQG